MEDYKISKKILNLFKHELETHTRPIDEISKEIELFEGVEFSVDDVISELSTALSLRIDYLKRIKREWEVELASKEGDDRENLQKYTDSVQSIIEKNETFQRYLYKDYEILDVGTDIE